ncbi:hypothetical protein SDC9_203684 [bioreactor metagenome]|uniref:Uncharacterized protein n=1 Tax=bioreactor metagenome TaxID=1076179 RepID=A0A645IYN2_9ZZZZ
MDEFVADEADGAACKPGQSVPDDRTELLEDGFHNFQAVFDYRNAWTSGFLNRIAGDLFALLADLDHAAGLPDDRARMASNK